MDTNRNTQISQIIRPPIITRTTQLTRPPIITRYVPSETSQITRPIIPRNVTSSRPQVITTEVAETPNIPLIVPKIMPRKAQSRTSNVISSVRPIYQPSTFSSNLVTSTIKPASQVTTPSSQITISSVAIPEMATIEVAPPKVRSPRLGTLFVNEVNPSVSSPRSITPFPTEQTTRVTSPRVSSPKIPLPEGTVRIPEPREIMIPKTTITTTSPIMIPTISS